MFLHQFRRICTRLAALTAAAVISLPAASTARAQDDNFRAVNVLNQFSNLDRYPDVMGFRIDAAPQLYPLSRSDGWTSPEHLQGLARSPRPGPVHMYFSVAGEDDPRSAGYITTVALPTRERSGERLRSNRLVANLDTRFSFPAFEDRPVRRFSFDGFLGAGTPNWWGWRHPGNLVTIGDLLLTPLEDKLSSNTIPTSTALAIFDITDPSRPVPVAIHGLNDAKAGTMAITRRPNGQYIVLIGGIDNGDTLVAYRSTATNLRDPANQFVEVFRWNVNNANFPSDYEWPGNTPIPGCRGKDTHQSYDFVTEAGTGRLFLIGTTKFGSCGSPTGTGTDLADLFEVSFLAPNDIGMVLTIRARRSFEFNNQYEGMVGNFVAGGAAYVSQAGTLLLYAAPHGPGADPLDTRGVSDAIQSFAELRPSFLNALATTGPGAAYLRLYDDTNFRDRSIVLDSQDFGRQTWNNVGFINDFNDRASSLVVCAPAGVSVDLFQDSQFRNLISSLPGFGFFGSLSSLSPNDAITSVNFSGSFGTTVFVNAAAVGNLRGTAAQPVRTVAQGQALNTGFINEVRITTGNYPENLRIAAPARYTAAGGPVRIGQ